MIIIFTLITFSLVHAWYWRALDSETRTTTSTRFSQYWVLLAREPASFWQENVIAVVNLKKLSHALEVYHFPIGSREGAKSPSESNNLTNFLGLATGLSQQLVFLNWRQGLLGAKHTRLGPASLSRQTRRLTQSAGYLKATFSKKPTLSFPPLPWPFFKGWTTGGTLGGTLSPRNTSGNSSKKFSSSEAFILVF